MDTEIARLHARRMTREEYTQLLQQARQENAPLTVAGALIWSWSRRQKPDVYHWQNKALEWRFLMGVWRHMKLMLRAIRDVEKGWTP